MRDNKEVDIRIAGSNATNGNTQLTNADIQRRNALWAKEAKALKIGDMTIEHVRLNLIKELLGYIRSRASLPAAVKHHSKNRNGYEYVDYYIGLDGTRYRFSREYDRSIRLNHIISKTRYVVIDDTLRDENLTRARIDRIATAIQSLSTEDFVQQCQRANPCAENGELFEQMSKVLTGTLADIRQQHAQYSGRHYVHIPGSRIPFFGSGSLFQSGAESSVLSAIKKVNDAYEKRVYLLQSHVEHSNAYNTFVNQLKL